MEKSPTGDIQQSGLIPVMRILIVSYEFPPYVGGAGSYARDLAVGLGRNGCQVDVLTCMHSGSADSLQEYKNIKIYRIFLSGKSYLFQMFIQMITLCFIYNYDLILFNDSRANKMAAFFQFFIRPIYKKSIAIFHGSEINNFFQSPSILLKILCMPFLLQRHYENLYGIIAVSSFMKIKITKLLPSVEKKIKIILHGIDDEIFFPLNKNKIAEIKNSLGLNEGASYIFSASRLVNEKGQDNVIKVFSEIEKKYKNLFLVIAGEGPARKQLEDLSKKYTLRERIIFTGAVNRKRMAELYGASEIFILLSRLQESFGLVYLEANACRRIAIGSRVGGVVEAVEEGVSGFTFAPENWYEVSEIVKQLLSDKEFKDKIEYSSQKRLLASHTCSAMAKRLLDSFAKEANL